VGEASKYFAILCIDAGSHCAPGLIQMSEVRNRVRAFFNKDQKSRTQKGFAGRNVSFSLFLSNDPLLRLFLTISKHSVKSQP
jgi:hypothetical protein